MQNPERRSALRYVGGLLLSLIGVALSVPTAIYLLDPVRRRRAAAPGPDAGSAAAAGAETTAGAPANMEAVPIATLAEVPDIAQGQAPLQVPVIVDGQHDAWNRLEKARLGSVWLCKSGERLSCLSAVCPHAGCGIDFDPSRRAFVCPCHGSTFAMDGQRQEGPSPRDMDRLDVQVQDGKVLCRYQRFRLATGTKEPV